MEDPEQNLHLPTRPDPAEAPEDIIVKFELNKLIGINETSLTSLVSRLMSPIAMEIPADLDVAFRFIVVSEIMVFEITKKN